VRLLDLAFVLLAAVVHVGWNLRLKRSPDRLLFSWWAVLAGTLLGLPLALGEARQVVIQAWPWLLVSALAEAVYFVALARAYGVGDFSLVYPLARGGGALLIALGAALVLGDRVTAAGAAGLATLLAGLLVVGAWPALDAHSRPSGGAAALAGVVALCIAVYSLADAAAVRRVPPVPFTVLVLGLSAAVVGPWLLAREGAARAAAVLRADAGGIVVVGAGMLLAYGLVLTAYAGSPAGYVGALREAGVPLAALAGWRLQREPLGAVRTAGALLVFVGALVVAVAG
jgi:drug/metabolite transporter (DMT)-like permease